MLGNRMRVEALQRAEQLELSLMKELRKLGARMQSMDRMIGDQLQNIRTDLEAVSTTAEVTQALEVAHEQIEAHLQAAESAAQKANAAAARAHRGLQKHTQETEEEELIGQSSNIDDGPYPHARHPKLG